MNENLIDEADYFGSEMQELQEKKNLYREALEKIWKVCDYKYRDATMGRIAYIVEQTLGSELDD